MTSHSARNDSPKADSRTTRPPPKKNAKGPPPVPFLKIRRTYELNAAETQFQEQLEDRDEKEDFRFFTIGVKLRYDWDSDMQQRGPDTVKLWKDLDEYRRTRYIDFANDRPDPHLTDTNFQVREKEKLFCVDFVPQGQWNLFKYAIIALKANSVDREMPEDEVIDIWKHHDLRKRQLLAKLGIHLSALHQQRPVKRQSQPWAHRYVEPRQGIPDPGPTRGDVKHIHERWISSKPGLSWVFEQTLFSNQHHPALNSQRVLHLFSHVDENRNIVSRMVVKIQGEPDYETAVAAVDFEYGPHLEFSKVKCPYIIECYGHSIRRSRFGLALLYGYLEYAPYGDLMDFLETENIMLHQAAEPFIWYVFRGLAEALWTLYTGTTIDADKPERRIEMPNHSLPKAPEWVPYVNVDVKPMNVVLANPRDSLPAYKTAKMIDFGLVYDPENLETAKSQGTEGYKPPEQWVHPDHPLSHPLYGDKPVNEGTPIFNLGLVIMSLMYGRPVDYDDQSAMDINFKFSFDDIERRYSGHLERLVLKCLELNPDDRATLHHVLYETRVGLQKYEELHGDIMNKPSNEISRAAKQWFKEDPQFKIGDRAPSHWAVRKKRKAAEDDHILQPPLQHPKSKLNHRRAVKRRRFTQ